MPRSSYYYKPAEETPFNLQLMRLIDEKFTECPFFGARRMAAWLSDHLGQPVNVKRIRRLMKKMRLIPIYPKPNLSKPHPQHRIFPYLLRGVSIDRVNQVWSTDITYIRIVGGFLYLTAIIDWYSRCVLSWELSNTMDTGFCISALQQALAKHGDPEVFNTDQGAQFTSNDFTGVLLARDIQVSMDGKGRALDNVFVERLWRSVKYEEVFLNDYNSGTDAYHRLSRYFDFYNNRRPHQSLGYRTPWHVYSQGSERVRG